ncbi:MAG: alpha/beta fold hydrolase [Candidatus Methylomirabilota bacterium]
MGQERLTIPAAGCALAAILHRPEGAGPWPVVVASHGMLSSKDSEKYQLVGAAFSASGIAVCRFDFRGCGESGGILAEASVGERVDDLGRVVAALRTRPELDGRAALLGSSMGAFVSLLAASRDPRVRAVAAWATPADLEDLVANPDEVREYGLGDPAIAELRAGRCLRAPTDVPRVLFLHGGADDVVPVAHAERLHAASPEPKRLHVFPGGDHPLTDPAHRQEAVRMSLEWIRRFL